MTDNLPATTQDDIPLPYAGESWETLTDQAHEVFGADLEKGDILVGVPFCIVRATFRDGDYADAATGIKRPYVSLDVIVGPENELAKAVRRGRVENLQVDPGEHLVINEAGTGAYRQVVQYLEATSRLQLPEGPEEGHLGESRFDYPDIPREEFDIRLLCPRGLRASEYENEYTKTGKTRYLG